MSPLFSMLLWNTLLAGGLGLTVIILQRIASLKSHPGLFQILWMLVLLKLIIPPIYTVPITIDFDRPSSQDTNVTQAGSLSISGLDDVLDRENVKDTSSTRWSIASTLTVTALAGTILLLVLSLLRTQRIAHLVRLAKEAPTWLQTETDVLAREMNVARRIVVLAIDGCVSPFLWVTSRGPAIVVPSALIDSFERDNLQLVIRHELCHYVRRDHWTNAFSMIVGTILWWNPVAWWARRELRFVQELCCDATVLANQSGQHRRYAETLLQTIDFVASDESTIPVPTTAFGSCSTFKRRIEMISRRDLSSRVPYVTRLLILPLGALLIATSPSSAHDEKKADEIAEVREEIRELKAALMDLKSVIEEVADDRIARQRDEDRRRESEEDEHKDRKSSWLSESRLKRMAERAELNDRQTDALFQLADMVDGNPRQFERLMNSDDLNDLQISVMKKLARANDRRMEEENEGRERRENPRLSRSRLREMARRAELNDRQTQTLFELAEMVDGNPRQFEGLIRRDNLNKMQRDVLKRLIRDDERREEIEEREHRREREEDEEREHRREREEDEEREHREAKRLTRFRLRHMAERADLNDRETKALFSLSEMVDGNPRQFEQLLRKDDLNDTQLRVLKKVFSDDDHENDFDDDRTDDDDR